MIVFLDWVSSYEPYGQENQGDNDRHEVVVGAYGHEPVQYGGLAYQAVDPEYDVFVNLPGHKGSTRSSDSA